MTTHNLKSIFAVIEIRANNKEDAIEQIEDSSTYFPFRFIQIVKKPKKEVL